MALGIRDSDFIPAPNVVYSFNRLETPVLVNSAIPMDKLIDRDPSANIQGAGSSDLGNSLETLIDGVLGKGGETGGVQTTAETPSIPIWVWIGGGALLLFLALR